MARLWLFIGKAACVNCHDGPLFSDTRSDKTAVAPAIAAGTDRGHAAGATLVQSDPVNDLGEFSDPSPDQCTEPTFMAECPEDETAFKTLSLRGAASRAPYMHAGQLRPLEDVLQPTV